MARAATLNRLGAALAPVSNWLGGMPGAGWLAEKFMGVDRRRPLPRFERHHFRKWFAAHRVSNAKNANGHPAPSGPIVLLDDCLTSYCEPGVNRAAVAVLEAAGYEVHLAGLGCCGRTLASKGFLADAQALAMENIERLLPWAERGVPIVGCEPSCVSMLVDDYVDLVPGDDARAVAARTALVDSHLVRAGISLPLADCAVTGAPAKLIVHGHCHQKALVGTAEMMRLLSSIPKAQVELVDSGCCGMAGSFGYEHYELSMAIGGRVLFPAINARPESTPIAPGFSCRHQITHATSRPALHPIELIARLLEK